ncbi:MAG: signal peptidase II [Zavarzinia sp.]|nr:signal peptidase II [Zavarzinia sp.]
MTTLRPFRRTTGVGLFAAIVALAVDQLSKALVVLSADRLSASVPVFPGFNLVFLRNDGVSFGMFGGSAPWLLVALALSICCWLMAVMLRTRNQIEAAGCGLVIGGALGNVVDRLRHGAVTDFLDFYVGAWHWPAFNLADTIIFCGVAALLFAGPLEARRGHGRT